MSSVQLLALGYQMNSLMYPPHSTHTHTWKKSFVLNNLQRAGALLRCAPCGPKCGRRPTTASPRQRASSTWTRCASAGTHPRGSELCRHSSAPEHLNIKTPNRASSTRALLPSPTPFSWSGKSKDFARKCDIVQTEPLVAAYLLASSGTWPVRTSTTPSSAGG